MKSLNAAEIRMNGKIYIPIPAIDLFYQCNGCIFEKNAPKCPLMFSTCDDIIWKEKEDEQ